MLDRALHQERHIWDNSYGREDRFLVVVKLGDSEGYHGALSSCGKLGVAGGCPGDVRQALPS